ncbi:hypothetical protein AB0K93_07630 [Streptomyces sp. NPDC052676]|uniref:hypothetical protein n=1 Tax=Streptomyces sp. NPDC052676 TaxID=3154953 RepID=UPI003431D5CB
MTDPFLAALDDATRTVVARIHGELPVVTPETPSAVIPHYYCCDPNWALCGADLGGTLTAKDGEQDCVVCVDLDESGGCPWRSGRVERSWPAGNGSS